MSIPHRSALALTPSTPLGTLDDDLATRRVVAGSVRRNDLRLGRLPPKFDFPRPVQAAHRLGKFRRALEAPRINTPYCGVEAAVTSQLLVGKGDHAGVR